LPGYTFRITLLITVKLKNQAQTCAEGTQQDPKIGASAMNIGWSIGLTEVASDRSG
jgi:hypothetical protein